MVAHRAGVPVGASSQGRCGETATAAGRCQSHNAIAGGECARACGNGNAVHAVELRPLELHCSVHRQLHIGAPAGIIAVCENLASDDCKHESCYAAQGDVNGEQRVKYEL